jgi:membrane protease YdiL (CAAX protease family)
METAANYCSSCGQIFQPGFGVTCPRCEMVPQTAAPALAADAPGPRPVTGWGVGTGLLTWGVSVALLFGTQIIAIIIYFAIQISRTGSMPKTVQIDWLLAMLSIGAAIPAHLLTLAFCWFVVTRRGQQPFWQSMGWGWHPQFKWIHAVALAGLMMGVAILFSKILPHQETDLEKILKLGTSVRVLTALLAVLSAPLVEEIVYRGVLFVGVKNGTIRQVSILFGGGIGFIVAGLYLRPFEAIGLKKFLIGCLIGGVVAIAVWYISELAAVKAFIPSIGKDGTMLLFGITDVSLLFALVHVPQYWGSWAAISTIVLLSLVLTVLRAATGSILPGVATHFFYNGVQSISLLLGFDESVKEKATQTAQIVWTQLTSLF